jgi:hypothetical protein
MHRPQPNKWALAFFRWFCHPDFKEEIEGDLLERFSEYSKAYGTAKANRLFFQEVIFLFRPAITGNLYQLTNTDVMINTKQNKRLVSILGSALALLLIPFVAMHFSNEVNWKVLDFVVAAILLMGTGLILELILRKITSRKKRIIFSLILFMILFLLWAELAVGLFGSPLAGS